MTRARSASLVAVALCAAGCGSADRAAPTTAAPAPATTGDAASAGSPPSVLVVTCASAGPSLSARTVAAARDGVHLRIVVAGAAPGTTVRVVEPPGVASEGGLRGDAVVAAAPGGGHAVACDGSDATAAFAVVDPARVYVPDALHCGGGGTTGTSGSFAAGTSGIPASARAAAVRSALRLRAADVVEPAGYPAAPDGVTYRVRRAGVTVATAHFFGDGHGGWLLDATTACTALFG